MKEATCVWRIRPELIVALDDRFGEPHDAYVNGSQVWLREDGPASSASDRDGGGPSRVVIEWRLHPVASYQRPSALTTYAVFPTIALALAEGNDPPVAPSELWDGLEAFAAYDDQLADGLEPAILAACVTDALGFQPEFVGLVDHQVIGDEWERRAGAWSTVDALIAQLNEPMEPAP